MIELFGPGDLRLTVVPAAVSLIGRRHQHWRDSPRSLLCGPGLAGVVIWGQPEDIALRLGGEWLKCERGHLPVLVRPESILWARAIRKGTQIYIRGAGVMLAETAYNDLAKRLLNNPPACPPPDLDARR